MAEKNREREILEQTLGVLRRRIPVVANVVVEQDARAGNQVADWLIGMDIGGTQLRFYAEVKANVTRAAVAALILRKAQLPYPMLLMATYINPRLAEELREGGIQFVDTVGNAYLNQPPLYVFVKGNKPPVDLAQPQPTFRPTALKVIFAFLCNPGLENENYRRIALAAGVALGAVGSVMGNLKQTGHLLEVRRKERRLIQKEALLARWLLEYPERLRPKLFLGFFRGRPGWWQQATLNPPHAQWGGEVAAAKLTGGLKPQLVTIYTDREHLAPLVAEYRIRKEAGAETEILQRFWNPVEPWEPKETVHPLLVYADLMATGNQRNAEIAKVIYERHLVRYIRES